MTMISPAYTAMMARYNRWQNRSLVEAADRLDSTELTRDRGAFFGSILGTFSHLLWGDSIWMHRFSGSEKPPGGIAESRSMITEWQMFKQERLSLDLAIEAWADNLGPDWISGHTEWYSGAAKREMKRSNAMLAVHFFNHQTHHRGQIHAMLTAGGAKPDDTDLMLMPGLG